MKNILLVIIATILIYLIYKQLKKNIIPSESEPEKIKNNPSSKFDQTEKPKSFSDKLPKINNKEYERAILVKNTTEEYLLDKIKEYGQLSQNKAFKEHNFKLAKSVDWFIIMINESIDFCTYHNLVGWFMGYEGNTNIPEISIGYARHKSKGELDYIFFQDPKNSDEDTEIGAFKNGVSFMIYLPDANAEFGNMVVTKNSKISFTDSKDFIAKKGFDLAKIKSIAYKEFWIKMNDL